MTVVIIPLAILGVVVLLALGPVREFLGYPTTDTEITQVINQSCASVAGTGETASVVNERCIANTASGKVDRTKEAVKLIKVNLYKPVQK